MFDKLELTQKRFDEINEKLMDPNIINDNQQYKQLMKEYKNLTPVVEKFITYKEQKASFEEAKEMLQDGGLDKDFKEIVQEQYDESKEQMGILAEELKILLLPKDPNDDKNVIVEIRGGAGGDEAALFANSLFRMYSMYAEAKGWKVEVIDINETELGGIKEVSFSINAEGAYSRLKFESGVHRVQRVPETESQGRVHTSTVTVAVLPEAEEVDIEINPADIQMEAFRSGGAGGQNVNKVSSAVRLTHIPSGVVVSCQTERSQLQNRENCMKMLRSKLLEEKIQQQNSKISAERKSQVGTGDRSERIRTYNYPQGRLTDHRINYTSYRLEDNLNGNIDDLIDALITADQALKLAASED
ncbi:peptide chain release factor 1 [Paludicola sp. MB14-C6]|uniref:peptide chain release factor 1 n=1 Tax=Paludihabitans sp. MB14-C6 TaxID=3070656 RepID=UPI0027DD34BD|nr:peptide chain release factor 1 [Paludicola sp. MB14-C6]WMJ22271.1 peptide chain release factor 1 [Paludicola sp. MB14-C6]